jgi:8-oxo-dGTP pyrophosphatase MutT (NUDIX family)
LELYRPVGIEEIGHRRQMLALLEGPGDPFSREHFDPGHFTASAFVLSPHAPGAAGDAELLMIHHRRLNRWLQPGGHVEPDDADLPAAARREAREETGLLDLQPISKADPLFDLDVHPIPARGSQPRHLHLDVRFLFIATSHTLEPATDAVAARWVPQDEAVLLNREPAMARVLGKLQTILETVA